VHELFLYNGTWQPDADLTQITGGPSLAAMGAMAFDPVWQGMRTHYLGEVQDQTGLYEPGVHELFLYNGSWQPDANLTQVTRGPYPSGSSIGIAMAFDPVWQGMRTHYFGLMDSHVHELFLEGPMGHAATLLPTGRVLINYLETASRLPWTQRSTRDESLRSRTGQSRGQTSQETIRRL
jgi:hypothetical protein